MPLYRAELLAKKPLWHGALIHDISQVLHLPFDYDDGSYARDRSGYNNHSTIYGAARVGGKIGMALSFDGVDDYVEVPHDPSINPTKELTIAAWVKSATENWNTYGWIVSKRNAYIIHPVGDSKYIELYIYDTAWHGIGYMPAFDIRDWHHYAGTYKDGYLRLYFDGTLAAGPHGPFGDINLDTGSLYIGSDDQVEAPGRYGNGAIDGVFICNRGLSAAEIRLLMYRRL